MTDNPTDGHNVPSALSTSIFTVTPAVVFGVWCARERTLSIHSIVTTSRELFYRLTVLLTCALGTAARDWTLDVTGRGSPPVGAAARRAHRRDRHRVEARRRTCAHLLAGLHPHPATRGRRPSVTSSAPTRADGGLGLGTLGTSLLFLASILVVVSYLTITDKDRTDSQLTPHSFTVRVTVMDDRITTPRTGHVDTDTIADGCTAPADGSR